MDIKNRYLILFFITLVIFTYLLISPTLTGFATLEIEKLNLSIPYTAFDGGSPLTGTINLTLKGDIPANSTVKVNIDGESKILDLIEILRDNNIEPEQTQTYVTASNPENTKTLNFDSSGTKKIAIKMKKGSLVDNITMIIEGISGYPKTPSISFGDNSYNDWYYIGNFLNYGDFLIPSGLNEGQEGQVILKTGNIDKLYCEKITLPLVSDFEIYSKFQILELQGTVIDTSLLIVEQNQAIGECLMDDPASALNWYSCELNLDRQISGDVYICLNMTLKGTPSSQDLIKMSVDSAQGNGYICSEGSSINCNKDAFRDYFIKIKPGAYSENLQTAEQIKDWETIPFSSRESLTNYLASCLVTNITENSCAIPIVVNSKSAGTIKLSNAKVDYRLGGVSTIESLKLYDLASTTTSVVTLPYSTNIIIPLSSFNLDVPKTKTNATVKVTVAGKSVEQKIQITPTAIDTTIPAAVKINNIKTYLDNVKTKDLIKALKLKDLTDSAYNKILDYQTQIQTISDSNKTDAAKETEYNNILSEANTLVNSLPKSIVIKTMYNYDPSGITPENAVTENIIDENNKDAVYSLQNKIKISSEASLLNVMYFSGVNETSTLIKDIITVKDSTLSSINVVKLIPKTVANSATSVYSYPQATVLKTDPLLKFNLVMPNNEIITLVKTNVIDNVGEISNLYLPEEIPTELIAVKCGDGLCNPLEDYASCPEDCKCGNKICELELGETEDTCPDDCRKLPWLLISMIAAIAAFGMLIYIYLHGHPERKEKLMSIFKKKKKLFKSDIDFKRLQQFVRTAKAKGYSKEQIKRTLLQKGWSEKQIEAVFK